MTPVHQASSDSLVFKKYPFRIYVSRFYHIGRNKTYTSTDIIELSVRLVCKLDKKPL